MGLHYLAKGGNAAQHVATQAVQPTKCCRGEQGVAGDKTRLMSVAVQLVID